MNTCFFIGRIISDIEFKFIVDNKSYYAIAIFQIKLNNKSIITVKGYNKIADMCYSKLHIEDMVLLQGYLNSKFEINIEKIEKL